METRLALKYATAPGNFNRDKNLDIVYCGATAVYVLFGNGAGDFSDASNAVAVAATSVAVADLNKDGNPDLVLGTYGANVKVALGNTNGTFQSPVTYPGSATTTGASVVAVEDFDADGKLDLAVLLSNTANGIGILTGRGDGTFNSARVASVTNASGVHVDVNFLVIVAETR
jgi:hypothetical protein